MSRHVDEVARLQSVLEDDRRPPVQQPRGEDRRHAGVRVRQRLARAVDVEEAERDRRDAVGRADDERELLVIPLGDRVDRGRDERLPLPRRHGASSRSHSGQRHSHASRQELLLGRGCGATRPCSRTVLALAVDRHRRGDDELEGIGRCATRRSRKRAGRHTCCAHIARDLVHRLAHADGAARWTTGRRPRARGRPRPDRRRCRRSARRRAGRSGVPSCTCASRLSSTTTSSPRSRSVATRCEPMNPAPPVTSVFTHTQLALTDRLEGN